LRKKRFDTKQYSCREKSMKFYRDLKDYIMETPELPRTYTMVNYPVHKVKPVPAIGKTQTGAEGQHVAKGRHGTTSLHPNIPPLSLRLTHR
jgi:hypothetical protein